MMAEALSRLMEDAEEEIDDETYAALQRSDAQLTRGEGLELVEVSAALRLKYLSR
jgi:hypothetical protein